MLVDSFSVSVHGSQIFLRLKAFDPTLDYPVEVLHTIPLGCIKYLVNYLVKNVLSDTEKTVLEKLFLVVEGLQAIDSNFANNSSQFELYKSIFGYILDKFIYAMYSLDDHLKNEANPPMFSLKPKVHMFHHILEDIERFGCPLQYDTESAEQFNKFIREHFFMTNRQFTSRDKWKERNVWYEAVVCSETGIAIKALLTENPKFKKHFFGARANITDSYQILRSKMIHDVTRRDSGQDLND
ncbi:hypothetical protein BD770DRAFT_449527 [Pilaira anomala]|nr:hypothetical protein BD770DRAFT_449527 [Pilaira anomala]